MGKLVFKQKTYISIYMLEFEKELYTYVIYIVSIYIPKQVSKIKFQQSFGTECRTENMLVIKLEVKTECTCKFGQSNSRTRELSSKFMGKF
jgi:hypothetical protein